VRNLVDFLAEAKAGSLWCYGAEADATVSYEDVDFRGGVVLVLGSEGRGLRPRVSAACDLLLRIPLHGKIASLSVASAAAVLLFAASRQRRSASE
jgi:23S rRNA (guanosine2251-2'-O)-methyltransferase